MALVSVYSGVVEGESSLYNDNDCSFYREIVCEDESAVIKFTYSEDGKQRIEILVEES